MKWPRKTLDQISTNLDSRRIPITKSARASGKYPYYGASGIVDYVADYIFEGDSLLISEDGANLLARSTPIAFPVSGKYWVNNHAHILKFDSLTTQRFVEMYLESIPLDEYITGAAQPKLNQKALNSIQIPFPDLFEQQRIVTILDQAFDVIAKARANAEKNLQNARALFESHLQSVFTERGEGWVEKSLEAIGKTQTGSTPKTSDQSNYGSFIPFVKPGDFNTDGSLDYCNGGLSETGAKGARTVPAGSVLMVCIGATIGKCGYCDQDVATNQQVNALTPTDGSSCRFLYYQMRTETFQRKVMHGSGQATLPIINKSKWSALSLWLPPTITEQETLAAKFDALIEETQRLESIYQQKLAALDELKQSLLHQAFSGNL